MTKISQVFINSFLPLKGCYQLYKACGCHISMDDFRGREKNNVHLKMTDAQEKQMNDKHIIA